MKQLVRPAYRRGAPFLLVLPLIGGCSDLQIDHRDELGMESEGRYELVVIDDSQQDLATDADVPAIGADSAATSLATPVYFDPEGGFTVQTGFYADPATAADKVKGLTDSGYPAYSIPSQDNSAIRVRIGYFTSRSDADRFGRIFVQDRGGDFWVDLRTNEAQ